MPHLHLTALETYALNQAQTRLDEAKQRAQALLGEASAEYRQCLALIFAERELGPLPQGVRWDTARPGGLARLEWPDPKEGDPDA